jgi:hypothetical protein
MSKLFGVSDTGSNPTPKQTFKQFCASATDKQCTQLFTVDVIWLPNKFSNYTLETHKFRLRITDTSQLFEPLGEFVGVLPNYIFELKVKIVDRESGEFELVENNKTKGEWKKLGASGWAFNRH